MNKDLVIIITGRVLQIVIMLVSIRILTTLLSPEEVGNYYLALTILAFFNLVLLNPSGMYFSRHLLHWQRSQNLLNALFVFILWMMIVAIFSIPIISLLFLVMGYDDKYSLEVFIAFIILAVMISTTHRNVIYGSNTLGYRKEFVIFLIITLILGLIFSSGLVYFYSATSLAWLFGVVISESLMVYFIFKFFIQENKLDIRKIKQKITKERIIEVLHFTLPIAITTFLFWGQTSAYRLIIDYKYSAEILGFIAVGIGISSSVFGSVESVVSQYFNPIFLKDILDANKEQRTKAWNKMASFVVPIYIMTAFFTVLLSKYIIFVLADEKFNEAYIYVALGVGIDFFRVMTSLVYNVSQSEYKTSYTIKPYLAGFVISLGLLSFIDFKENYFMIVLSLGFSYFIVFLMMFKNMKKLLDIKIVINYFKLFILTIPLFTVYFVSLDNEITKSIFVILVYGMYYLFTLFILIKSNQERYLKL